MKIIPKEVIEAQNALRANLREKKTAFISLIEEVQKTTPEFTGSEEEVNALPDGNESKSALIAARSACAEAAEKVGVATWFEDVKRQMAAKKREEARKAREEANKNK